MDPHPTRRQLHSTPGTLIWTSYHPMTTSLHPRYHKKQFHRYHLSRKKIKWRKRPRTPSLGFFFLFHEIYSQSTLMYWVKQKYSQIFLLLLQKNQNNIFFPVDRPADEPAAAEWRGLHGAPLPQLPATPAPPGGTPASTIRQWTRKSWQLLLIYHWCMYILHIVCNYCICLYHFKFNLQENL